MAKKEKTTKPKGNKQKKAKKTIQSKSKKTYTQKEQVKKDFKSQKAHLFQRRPRRFGIGGDLPHPTDLSRVVKWPKYIKIQRQRAILKKRLKIPPAIHQFSESLDKNQASTLFKLMLKYRPETRSEKKRRLYLKAKDEVDKKECHKDTTTKPKFLKFGLKHVTHLVEQKKAKLVIIAHDVDPIELVVWLPALCKKMDVPYCIVKSKARLGAFVHQKTTACLAITDVKKGADDSALENIIASVKPLFNDAPHRTWGGGSLGAKALVRVKKIEKELEREARQKMGV